MKWTRAFWVSRIGKEEGIVAGVWAGWRSIDLGEKHGLGGEALTWGKNMDWGRSIDLGEKQ